MRLEPRTHFFPEALLAAKLPNEYEIEITSNILKMLTFDIGYVLEAHNLFFFFVFLDGKKLSEIFGTKAQDWGEKSDFCTWVSKYRWTNNNIEEIKWKYY